MTRIREYHRPATVAAALELLGRADVLTVPLGGGTVLNGVPDATPDAVVDLQSLGLSSITRDGETLRFGAMARLQDVVDHEWTPPVLRDLAHGEAPNTLRNAATVGGTVAAADPESRFLAGLLAHGAIATLATLGDEERVAVADLLAHRSHLSGKLIVAVSITIGVKGSFHGTGRTPADTPIVLVVGTAHEDAPATVAATGLAESPILINLDEIDSLDPPGDFRGAPAYRRHLATVLGARVMADLAGDSE